MVTKRNSRSVGLGLVVLVISACSFIVDFRDGIRCRSDDDCDGYVCVDGRCRSSAQASSPPITEGGDAGGEHADAAQGGGRADAAQTGRADAAQAGEPLCAPRCIRISPAEAYCGFACDFSRFGEPNVCPAGKNCSRYDGTTLIVTEGQEPSGICIPQDNSFNGGIACSSATDCVGRLQCP